MNVLLTSSGRRTYLVEYFKKALNGEGLVFASNSVMSPALYAADGYGISPLIYSEAYIPWLLRFCREKNIGLLVPLFDIDLPVLARHRREFEEFGVVVAVSPEETLRLASDKFGAFLKLWKAGIRCPESVLSVEEALLKIDALSMDWPVMIKPRFGMGSIGTFTAENKEELKILYQKCRRQVEETYLKYESAAFPEESVLIQEKRSGKEYGLDVICDFNGRYQNTIVRRKEGMRSGETDEAVILGPEDGEYACLKELGEKLAALLEIRGIMDVDVIMEPAAKAPYVIDLNARFGGGYPFSHLAGADLPRAYLAWAKGEKAEEGWLQASPGVHGYKDISIRAYPQTSSGEYRPRGLRDG